jgi:hypothetical protein
MDNTSTLTKTDYFRLDITLPALAFLIPFLISGPQWLTGTVVNCFLLLFVVSLPRKNYLPIIILPSIGVLLHGVVFGPMTFFLYYFLPFIWLSNLVYVQIFQILLHKTTSFSGSLFISALIKAVILYSSARLFLDLGLVPSAFLVSMGTIQLVTALTGGLLVYFIIKLNLKHE